MLLRDSRGALRTVTEVIPAVERREVFNGKKRYLLERCASVSVKPNALVFTLDDGSNNPMVLSQSKLLIGNLKTEVAEGIIRDLMEKGVADISGFRFQKESPLLIWQSLITGLHCHTLWIISSALLMRIFLQVTL